MKNKILYEVQGNPPSQYCVDEKDAKEKLNKLLAAADKVLEYLNNNKK